MSNEEEVFAEIMAVFTSHGVDYGDIVWQLWKDKP